MSKLVETIEGAEYDDNEPYDPDTNCWYCDGEGWGLVGCDWDEDWERGWYSGDTKRCPNCGGSGRAEDCTFW